MKIGLSQRVGTVRRPLNAESMATSEVAVGTIGNDRQNSTAIRKADLTAGDENVANDDT